MSATRQGEDYEEAVILSGPRRGEIIRLSGDRECSVNEEAALDALEALEGRSLTVQLEVGQLGDTVAALRRELRDAAAQVQEMKRRITRLEAARDADRDHMATLLTRVELEMERVELRLARMPPPVDRSAN